MPVKKTAVLTAAPQTIDTDLYQLIVEIYSRWHGQEIAEAIGYYRQQQENAQRIEQLRTEIESRSAELTARTAK